MWQDDPANVGYAETPMPEFLDNPRRVPRDAVRCRASVASAAGAMETTTEDIGSRGCQVVLPAAMQRGAVVTLTLQAPRFPVALRIEGRVVWVSPRPPWRVGIAYSASGLAEAARWMEGFRQASPELFVRERRPIERVPVDAMVFLGVAPKLADFTEDELTVLRTIASGQRVAELRTALSGCWPRMQRSLFSLLSKGYATLSRAAAAHPVTWKAVLGAPPAPPAPGVTLVDDALVLESLLERSAERSAERPTFTPPPAPTRTPAPQPRRSAPGTPTPPSRAVPTPVPRAAPAAQTPPPLPRQTPLATSAPPPLPTAASSGAPTRPGMEARREPVHDFVGAGVGWRSGATQPRSSEADAIYQLALIELDGRRSNQALALLRRALTLSPGDAEIAHAIGRAMKGS
jgi:hypothetical protein